MRGARAFSVGGFMFMAACGACSNAQTLPQPRNAAPVQMAAHTQPEQQPQPQPSGQALQMAAPAERPKLEVVFVLDTTGSMSSLIDGAKQKIWSIADELASGQPRPELRIGLIAYRDRGDAYVTQRFALSDDIDTVYKQLYSLSADGGGDGPESVNQALHEAVHDTPWSQDTHTYRAVFLVGDAPPHMDYQDDVPFDATVKEASARGIVLNTVQCGSMEGTHDVWAAIAHGGQGTYASIQQDGGMRQIAAPMDEEIGRVNAALSATIVPYGAPEKREGTREKARMAAAAPAAVSASRQSFLAKKGGEVLTGGGDLLDDVKSGRADLSHMKSDELPSDLRGLSVEQQRKQLAQKQEQRKQLQQRLDTLVKERAGYVRAEEAKRRAAGEKAGFDDEVMKSVKDQASRAVGIAY
jgi:Mg-chelatase subunit ChlD